VQTHDSFRVPEAWLSPEQPVLKSGDCDQIALQLRFRAQYWYEFIGLGG
jgi:hypothetical protein